MARKKTITRQFEIDAIHSAFRFSWDDRFVFRGESHDFWEVVFLTDGNVEAVQNEKIYILEKNNMILHAPLQFHSIRSIRGTEPKGVIFSFHTTGHLPENLNSGLFVLSEETAGILNGLCSNLIRYFYDQEDDPYAGQEVSAALTAFLLGLRRQTTSQKIAAGTEAVAYRKILTAMNDGVRDNLTLEDISGNCNVSISYIKLLFGKYANMSPMKYYSQLRCMDAEELLKCGMSVVEVSNLMNFSSPSYFSAFFKKHRGIPPSVYQKQLRPHIY